ncbi:MAG: adenosylcobinamide-GDP ribazoletransferase [Lachnospiraceae bacterium]
MKKMWNSFKIAFSMYSKIPMPKSDWTKENMSYAMIFFPWIGAVIGILMVGIYKLKIWCLLENVPVAPWTFTVLFVVLPVFLTGGIHMDGFLDTQDAIHSYQPKEKKLEILKDPHAGAFAILSCVLYFLCATGIYASVSEKSIWVIASGFVLSRTLSGLSVVCFPQAREKGLAATFSENARKRTVRLFLFFYLVLVCAWMVLGFGVQGTFAVIAAGVMFLYYYRMSRKNFGGITGDLAGYFLQMCELLIAAAAVFADIIVGGF